jgi:hypothetical protein
MLDSFAAHHFSEENRRSSLTTTPAKTPSLRIVQPQPMSGQLWFSRAILFTKERAHIALLPPQPSEHRAEEHL